MSLHAGVSSRNITPTKSLFLYGYPHVERMSEGVNDPLLANAMVLDNGEEQIVFCSVDLIYFSKELAKRIRRGLESKLGIPEEAIMLSATHTHSGPIIVRMVSNIDDPVVPPPDKEYIDFLASSLIDLIAEAYQNKIEVEFALTVADGTGIGGNRRSDEGAIDPEIPVMVVRRVLDKKIIGLSTVYCMHPTVLHEDFKLYSADFPGYTREYILDEFGEDVVYLYHTGPEGNQSPRRFIRENTVAEAKRLGYELGKRIVGVVRKLSEGDFKKSISLKYSSSEVLLSPKQFPSVEEAEKNLKCAIDRLNKLKSTGASRVEIRTAECDWFGAEELVTLARLSSSGELEDILREVLPAEVQVFKIDEYYFVALPGEWFVEYSLEIKQRAPGKTFVICLANGELQGYIVTEEAYREGGYEASNSMFAPNEGRKIIEKALEMIRELNKQ